MKKTILAIMVVMVILGSITTNIFMGFQINKLNNTVAMSLIKEETLYTVDAEYTYGGHIITEDGEEFIYGSESYDDYTIDCNIKGIAIKAVINDNGTPCTVKDDRVITIWENKENLTSIKDVEYEKEELTAMLKREVNYGN